MPSKKPNLSEIQLPEAEGPFEVKECMSVNHKPHPFVVGPKHVEHASETHMGMLGEETLRAIPCAECRKPYDEHTHDRVAVVNIKQNTSNSRLRAYLLGIKGWAEENQIDGFVLVKEDDVDIEDDES